MRSGLKERMYHPARIRRKKRNFSEEYRTGYRIHQRRNQQEGKTDDLIKILKRRISVIMANPGSGPGQAPESRVPGENRDPVFEVVPDFRRDDVWTPVSTGVTTFYENIKT